MIIKARFFAVECDNCKNQAHGQEEWPYWYSGIIEVEENAMESEWLKEGDKHYCPDCFSYDDEDKLIIKTKDK